MYFSFLFIAILCCRIPIKQVKAAKHVLVETFVEQCSGTVRTTVQGMRAKRNNSRTKQADRKCNEYRKQLNSLYRTTWKQLPNVEQISYSSFRSYICTDATYDDVVYEVASVVHKFLFCGLQSLTFEGFDPKYEVVFPSIEGNIVDKDSRCFPCIFLLG